MSLVLDPSITQTGEAALSEINKKAASAIVTCREVCKHVPLPSGSLTILDTVSLTINAGEAVAVVGASGSGKSTLLALMAGLDLPSSGDVILDGMRLSDLDEDGRAAARAARVGFVFQSFQLLPSLNALENVMLPMELAGNRSAESEAKDFLQQVGLGERLKHYPRQLSGGEQQRVAIARAFACKPKVLFADEPTGNLDTETGQSVANLLFELNQHHNATLILVTHDERLAARCHRQLRMAGGKLL